MRSFVFCGLADRVLACLGQSSEVFFDTQQDATCARLYARAFSTLNKTTSFLWIG
jgi:hypothetical protein